MNLTKFSKNIHLSMKCESEHFQGHIVQKWKLKIKFIKVRHIN